jgi:hypothetical protein
VGRLKHLTNRGFQYEAGHTNGSHITSSTLNYNESSGLEHRCSASRHLFPQGIHLLKGFGSLLYTIMDVLEVSGRKGNTMRNTIVVYQLITGASKDAWTQGPWSTVISYIHIHLHFAVVSFGIAEAP